MASYMANRRRTRRQKLVEMAGSSCKTCGSTEELEFDHRDPEEMAFRLSGAGLDKAWEKILVEFAKCDLLCSRCHDEKSDRENDGRRVSHGGGLSGKRNCPCVPCRERMRHYRRTRN